MFWVLIKPSIKFCVKRQQEVRIQSQYMSTFVIPLMKFEQPQRKYFE